MTEKIKLVQLIHIAKNQLNMDEESYRAMLKRLTNKTSSTKCTVIELHKILHELQSKGAKVKYFPKRGGLSRYSPTTGKTKVNSEIVHKIRAVWITMGKQGFLRDGSETALNAYVRKVINNKNRPTLVLNVGALYSYDAAKILEMLKKWHKRVMMQAIDKVEKTDWDQKVSYERVAEYFEEVMNR